MHSVTESATAVDARERRRARVSHQITVQAQRLTDAHGVDGFTMDDLARAAGVSRRTLFNYFDSKVDAILGRKPDLPEDALATFRAGGPTGDLVTDMAGLAAMLISSQTLTREEALLSRRVLEVERLLEASHARMAEWTDEFVALVAEREGTGEDDPRARIAVAVFIALLDISLDRFVAGPADADFATTYAEILTTTRALMAPAAGA